MEKKHVIWDILTSGKATEGDKEELSDYIIRYIIMNFISIFGFIFLVFYILFNLGKGSWVDAVICIGMSVVVIISFITARTRVVYIVPALIILVCYNIFCILLIWNGDAQGVNILFIYLFPSLTLILLGMKQGIVHSVILIVVVCIEVFVPNLSRFDYTTDIASRVIVTYLLIFGITIAVETTKAAKDKANLKLTKKLQEESQRAEAATLAKSNFLANTSHEIRTPMNAILGMTELILRKDKIEDIYEDARSIKQAGSNLLSIINDILEFSKIESGKLDIVEADYQLGSVINDVISIIRTRLSEKPILFTVDIDSEIPNNLVGDEVRVRQVLMNLLSNAVKYTREGHIILTVTGEDREDRIVLSISVSDTGIGIKQEDMGKLFGEFQQLDTHKNQGIEGTGLGLAISLRLCRLMGGDISVESVYGEGSVFTAVIPQRFRNREPLAAVEKSETKTILLYETRREYAQSLIRSIENLGVSVTAVENAEHLGRELKLCSRTGEKPYSFAFVNAASAEEAQAMIRDLSLPTKLVLLVNPEEIASFKNIPVISRPAYTLSLANVINEKTEVYHKKAGVRFTAPGARLLIVDDIVTNLNVAEGLLSLYQTDITTVTSGREAIELIKKNRYDIVFMDHMMPELDGIETTAAIRAWEDEQQMLEYAKPVPIIALTANAVTGMKEMFLSKGFNDYLSKPIEISKLDGMMAKWIPLEKRVNAEPRTVPEKKAATTDIKIAALDVATGIAMTGGEASYRKVLAVFRKDALKRLPLLEHVPGEPELSLFTTNVHALKSAAATIGAASVSKEAAELEAAGKAGDLSFITGRLPQFYRDLQKLAEQIERALNEGTPGEAEGGTGFAGSCIPLFRELAAALEQLDIGTIRRILGELVGKSFDAKTKEAINNISNAVLMSDFEEAINEIEALTDNTGEIL